MMFMLPSLDVARGEPFFWFLPLTVGGKFLAGSLNRRQKQARLKYGKAENLS
jgi:hypothetical protein